MPKYTIQVEDGRKVTLESPDEATALADADSWASANPAKAPTPARKLGFFEQIVDDFKEPERNARAGFEQASKGYRNALQRAQKDPSISNIGATVAEGIAAIPGQTLNGAGLLLAYPAGAVNTLTKPAARGIDAGARAVGLNPYRREGGPFDSRLVEMAPEESVNEINASINLGLGGPARGAGASKLANKVRPAPKTVVPDEVPQVVAPSTGTLKSTPKQAQVAKERLSKTDKAVAKAVAADLKKDRISPLEYKQRLEKPPEGALPYDLAGKSTRGGAEAIAQSSGPGAGILEEAAVSRGGQAVTRIKAEIGQALGGRGDYFDNLDKMLDAKAVAAREGMSQIAGTRVPLDENSIIALRSERARGAIKDEAQNLLASIDPEDRNAGAMLNGLHDAVLDNPAGAQIDVSSIQNISRALLSAGKEAFKTDGAKGRALTGLGKALRDNARQKVTEYDGWLKAYSEASGNEDALELGRNIFTGKGKIPYERLEKAVADMSEAERLLYQKGVGEALFERARSSAKGSAVVRDLLKTEDFADRARLAFPNDDAFNRFRDFAQREKGYADTDNAIFGNSATARRLERSAMLEDQGADGVDMALSGAELLAAPQTAPMKLGKLANKLRQDYKANQSVMRNEEANAAIARAYTDPAEMSRILDIIANDLNVSPIDIARAPEAVKSAVAAVVQSNGRRVPFRAKQIARDVIRGRRGPDDLRPFIVVNNLGQGGTLPSYAGAAAAQEGQE